MRRLAILGASVALLGVLPAGAGAEGDRGFELLASVRPKNVPNADPWGLAIQGSLLAAAMYEPPSPPDAAEQTTGVALFRITADERFVRQLSFYRCDGWREVAVWKRWAFQSVYSGDSSDAAQARNDNTFESDTCNSTDDSTGRFGLRVIDISDPRRPYQIDFIDTPCGVGPFALFPRRGKLYVLSNSGCADTLGNPAANGIYGDLEVLVFDPRRPRSGRLGGRPPILPMAGCVDIAVLVSRDLMSCANLDHFALFDLSDPPNPTPFAAEPTTVADANGLSASAFTWDGQYLAILEAANIYTSDMHQRVCSEDASVGPKIRFFNIEDPAAPQAVSTWTLPRAPCAPFSIQMLPSQDRYLVSVTYGSSGFEVIDFSDPTSPRSAGGLLPDEVARAGATEGREFFGAYWFAGPFYVSEHTNLAPTGRIHVVRWRSKLAQSLRRQPRFNPRTQVRLR